METQRDERELEALIEAQARGEKVEGIRAETEESRDAELDTRISKGDGGGKSGGGTG